MALGTYGDLKEAMAGWLARSNLTDRIPDFVELAESRINHGSYETGFETPPLRIRQMETEADLTLSAGEASLPTGFLELSQLYRVESGSRIERLLIVPEDWVFNAWEQQASGNPDLAAIRGDKIICAPVSSSDVTLKCLYWKSFDPLSDDADTNWLLQNAPQVYLSAALAEAFHYVRNLQEAQTWLQKYRGAVKSLERSDEDARRSAIDWRVRPDHVTP